ncbi:SDR family NAD(P)-dependent oxidoreductase [Larkinella soli]|uniref:SDR family NAD(P)-dependent oxidoreductase n=1 Tax=Larkinella soli TaxID=1770527 RepID=UPI000FFBF57F|nr:SDR family NAD(P)-dependent oxidoreductase [Larkinella soli]
MLSGLNEHNMVLITGANGLIGSHLVRRYLEAGHPVAALRRAESDLSLLDDVRERVTFYEGDILDIPSLEDAVRELRSRGPLDLIHAAAIISYSPKDRDRMEKVNVEGTANVVNVCLGEGVRKLGFVSSIAALGRPARKGIKTDGPVVISEEQRWEDSPNNSFYGKTKYRAELEVWRGMAEGLDAVIVNPTLVLGEGDWSRSSTQLFKYAWDERPFYPAGTAGLVDVRDVADALYLLMQSELTAERFLLNAATMPYQVFFNKVADAFGRKRPSIRVSPGLTRLLWPLEALRSRLTGKPPLITRETARSASSSYQYEGRKIEKMTPFRYRPIDETIQRISAFFSRRNGR